LNKNSAYAFSYAVDMAKGPDVKIVILHAIELIRGYSEVAAGITDEMAQTPDEIPCGRREWLILFPNGKN